jgi:hypothetical protein
MPTGQFVSEVAYKVSVTACGYNAGCQQLFRKTSRDCLQDAYGRECPLPKGSSLSRHTVLDFDSPCRDSHSATLLTRRC